MLVPRALKTFCLSVLLLTGCVCGDPGGSDGGDSGVPVEEDAGVTCTPPLTTDPCLRGVCDSDGTPRLVPVDDGTVLAAQTAGDCKSKVCVGGTATDITDDTDLPNDNLECTLNLCVSGAPSHPALASGTSCAGGTCDGAGACVQCTRASQCPGTDTECRVRTCVAGTCGFSNTPAGTPLAVQTPGDCQRAQCDGNGAAASVADNADLNEDGNQCTLDTCNAGTPSRVNAPIDTTCGVNLRCNATGVCVGCNAPAHCGAAATCKQATCTNGACGIANATNGSTCTDGNACTQTDTCQSGTCTGTNPVTCTATDQCHVAGTCQPADGGCTNPNATDGTGCNDSDACTQTDTCQSGACSGANPVVCSALDLCHLAGTCAPATGTCTDPFADGGTPCAYDGGNQCDGAGNCYLGLPWVVGTIPAEGATNQSYATTITVLFSEAMDALTVTALPADGACSGSLQISNDGFVNCLGVGTLNMISGNTAVVATMAPELSCGTTYQVRVTNAAQTPDARAITAYTTPTGFTTGSCFDDLSGSVVISQVYTAGGNSGATLDADLVELHNRGEFTVNLSNWSLQYASASGTSWDRLDLTGSIAPGGYYLAQVSPVGGNGGTPPTPDVTGTSLALAAASGRVALVGNQTTLSGLCPASSAVIDYVGWGASTTCIEAAPPVALSTPTVNALFRRIEGCQDTDANSADFLESGVFPRNSATPPWACVTANESNQASEVDDCVLQFPTSFTADAGVSSEVIYGRLYEPGVTEAAGPSSQVRAQLGYGPFNTNASTQSSLWTWVDASFNVQVGNDDEYQATFTTPAYGAYRYVYRFSIGGMPWTYCDVDGAGTNGTLRFDPSQAGAMTISPGGT